VQTISGPPDVPAQAEHLRVALARTARRLRQEAGADVGPTLIAALGSVERHGPLTPSALADRERIRRPTATRVIGKLVERGLVDRTPVPGDARSSHLTITGVGRDLLADVRTRKDAFLARRLAALPPEDRATLARAADLLEALLEDESGERS
jgi:DNA-binding MarR family transcriptional regulator